jgi:ABC-type uncharacterized transport system permease subunit
LLNGGCKWCATVIVETACDAAAKTNTLQPVSLTDRQFFLAAVVIYGLSMVFSVFVWRKNFRADNRVNYGLLLAGLVFHTISLAKRGFSIDRCPVNNLYEATSFFIWALVAAYAAIGVVSRFRFLGGFVSPLAFAVGVFALMPSLDPPPGPESIFTGGWISLHAAMIMLSYGAFGLSSVAAVMYLTQEHDLKLHKIKAILSKLPSIERIESVVSRLLTSGFALLTVGLLVIPLAVDKPEQISFASDSKVLWSGLVWLIYLVLIVWHWRFHLAGKRFAWGALGSFIFVLLTFWGTNLMSQLHN